MRVLLTGAAGFIGSAVATELQRRGDHEVVAVDALIPQAHSVTAPPPGVHAGDVRDATTVSPLLDDVDVVCHQAAMVGAGVDVSDMPLYAGHNDLGTAALLAAMADRGVSRLVLASSMVVYGEGRYVCPRHGPQHPGPRLPAALERGIFDNVCPDCGAVLDWALVNEQAPLEPRSSYAASKVAQEHYARAWARALPGSVVALRYHNVYGPGMPPNTPYAGVAALFRSAIERGESPRVFEDGHQMRDFVHVDDVAAANALAVETAATADPGTFEAYNVCSGHPVSIADVAATLCTATGAGREPVVTGEFRPGDVRHVVASPAKATDGLGFQAEISPATGLSQFTHAPLRC